MRPFPRKTISYLDLLRFLLEIISFVVLAVWGFSQFELLPWGLVAGIGAPAAAITLWALFVSPSAVVNVDAFGRALVEIIVYSAAGLALIFMGQGWFALVYLVSAVIGGILNGRRVL